MPPEPTLHRVVAPDGVELAVETVGQGPPLVLVSGAFCDRTTTRVLAGELADAFTVHAYDRRGRGDSGPAHESGSGDRAVEIADLLAVLGHAGERPALYGHSSGAVLAAEAAFTGAPLAALALYEPPWSVVADPARGASLRADVGEGLAAGRPADAVAAFLTGGPGGDVDAMRAEPWWSDLEARAHWLPADLAVVGDGALPAKELGLLGMPTLVMDGARSPQWARGTVAVVHTAIPGGTRHTFDDQDHAVDQRVLAPVLRRFLGA